MVEKPLATPEEAFVKEISQTSIGIGTWISNRIHVNQRYVIIHTWPNFNGFDILMYALIKRLDIRWICLWFQTPWRSCDIIVVHFPSMLVYVITILPVQFIFFFVLINGNHEDLKKNLLSKLLNVKKLLVGFVLIYIVQFIGFMFRARPSYANQWI